MLYLTSIIFSKTMSYRVELSSKELLDDQLMFQLFLLCL